MNNLTVSDFLKITSKKLNFNREKYIEKNIPSNFDQITVLFNLGDLRNTLSLSSMILPKFRKETKSLRYFIVFSYPGFSSLFPYADEFWSFDQENFLRIYNSSLGLDNFNSLKTIYLRHFNENFREVIKSESFNDIYDHFFLKRYWEKNKNIRIILPQIINSYSSNDVFVEKYSNINTNRKIFIFPNKTMQIIRKGKLTYEEIKVEFWINLIKKLLNNNISVICVKHPLTHDISSHFIDEKNILFFNEIDLNQIMSLMRMSECVFDFFSGISRLAIAARTPYILADERIRYFNYKEYEFEDVVGESLYGDRFFIFADLLNANNDLYSNIASNIISKIDKIKKISKGILSSEYIDKLSNYQNVRYYQSKKMGLNFLKFPKVY